MPAPKTSPRPSGPTKALCPDKPGVLIRGVLVIDAMAGSRHDAEVTRATASEADTTEAHEVWILSYPGLQSLDLVGPFEVFAAANRVRRGMGRPGPDYRLRVVTVNDLEVTSESGLSLKAEPIPEGPGPNTLLIPGGDGVRVAATDPNIVAEVARLGVETERLLTVCTGAFLAAAAGLLDGKRVATHWARAGELAKNHPAVEVDADALYLRDGSVWSSAGVMAGVDLALAVVEHDHDAEVAQVTARWLVVHLRRPGGQSPFADPIWTDPSPVEPIRRAQEHIQANPKASHSIAEMAERVGLSARHFSRLFTAEVGESPGRFVERTRVEAARRDLESTRLDLSAVALRCGFGSTETLRRSFVKQFGLSPSQYRRRFHLTPLAIPA